MLPNTIHPGEYLHASYDLTLAEEPDFGKLRA